jgi:hypothetical protein
MIFRLAFFAILVVAALLALFFFTRKKWNWNSYIGSLTIAFSALLIIPIGMFAWVSYENRVQTLNTLANIQLGATSADVKLLKGEPFFQLERPEQKMHWRYQDKLYPGNLLDVILQNGKVIEISFTGTCQYCEKANGFGIDAPYEDIFRRLGEPAEKIISTDELEQRINYPQYHTFYIMREGKVIRQGIYQ